MLARASRRIAAQTRILDFQNRRMLVVGSAVLGVSDVPRAAAFWMEALGCVPRKDMAGDWVVLVPAERAGVQPAPYDRARTSFAWLTAARPAWS